MYVEFFLITIIIITFIVTHTACITNTFDTLRRVLPDRGDWL